MAAVPGDGAFEIRGHHVLADASLSTLRAREGLAERRHDRPFTAFRHIGDHVDDQPDGQWRESHKEPQMSARERNCCRHNEPDISQPRSKNPPASGELERDRARVAGELDVSAPERTAITCIEDAHRTLPVRRADAGELLIVEYRNDAQRL